MSKSLTEMNIKELEAYMSQHKDNREKYQQAYSIYINHPDWHELPDDISQEEQEKVLLDYINQFHRAKQPT